MQDRTAYIEGTKAAPVDLGDVLVLGLGKSGRAIASYCAGLLGGRVRSLTIAAGERTDEAAAFAEGLPAEVRVLFDRYTFEGSFDVCVASPGISQFSRFYENAAAVSREVVSEVEFAWRESAADSCWIAITGTNGKTTTTTLCMHLLTQAGLDAVAVGNIGNTCIDAVAEGGGRYYVAEVSSFQLASMHGFAPQVAVLLNITPDHLYWHMTFDAYVAAKKNVYVNLAETGGVLVIDAVNDVSRACIKELKGNPNRGFSYIPLGSAAGLSVSMIDACGSDSAAWVRDGMLAVSIDGEATDLIRVDELQIKGEHNASNALAAAAAALVAGVDVQSVRRGLRSFAPLEHRLEPCGSVSGVACFNDSKATNVDATLKALESFPSAKPVFLLGGHDKGTDLSPLVESAQKHCSAVVCFGAAADRFMEAFEGSLLTHVKARHMEDALDAALALAGLGGAVVLSPACASFDEFDSFEHRGRVFKHLVAFRAQNEIA